MKIGLKMLKTIFADDYEKPMSKYKFCLLLSILLISYLLILFIREEIFLLPVAITPLDGTKENSTSVVFRWNPIANKNVTYDFQLYEKNSGFKKLLYDVKQLKKTKFRVTGLKPNQSYYWRIRSHWKGKIYSWSYKHYFRIEDFYYK